MKPFWENEYLNKEKSTFGTPSKEVEDIVSLLPKGAKILDVGCGDGRHSLYLATLGFQVDAFDISESAINKIDYLKEQNNLNINTYVCDVLEFEFKYKYDLIIVHGVLQFIEREKQPEIIELLKNWTEVNGYHIVALFTDEEPVPEDLKDVMVGLFKNEEVKDYYNEWEIKMFESYKFNDEHENGIKHCHALNKIVVKKIVD
jgi:tellurite methyltransferase